MTQRDLQRHGLIVGLDEYAECFRGLLTDNAEPEDDPAVVRKRWLDEA